MDDFEKMYKRENNRSSRNDLQDSIENIPENKEKRNNKNDSNEKDYDSISIAFSIVSVLLIFVGIFKLMKGIYYIIPDMSDYNVWLEACSIKKKILINGGLYLSIGVFLLLFSIIIRFRKLGKNKNKYGHSKNNKFQTMASNSEDIMQDSIYDSIKTIQNTLDEDDIKNDRSINYCPNCGNSLADDEKFCSHCGKKIK